MEQLDGCQGASRGASSEARRCGTVILSRNCEALGLSVGEVDEHTAVGSTPQWDSLADMRLILALEQRLGQPLTPEAIVGLSSFADVAELLCVIGQDAQP